MKLYVENREKRMSEALFRHIACLMIDRFGETSDENKEEIAKIRDFDSRCVKVKDINNIDVLIESGEEYGLHWIKITAADSAYQLESDLMNMRIWDTIWSWLGIASSVKAITVVEGQEYEDRN